MPLSETQAEEAFIQTFFVDTWRYVEAGCVAADQHTIIAIFPIPGEGASGGTGEADLALGWFRGQKNAIAQVLCEFKDIRSKLDARQNRKGVKRSPVEQCLNYVRGARRGLFGNEPVQPWWGLVTDMNEFRLYWWGRAPAKRYEEPDEHLSALPLQARRARCHSQRFGFRQRFEHELCAFMIVHLPRWEKQNQRLAILIGDSVQLGVQAAFRRPMQRGSAPFLKARSRAMGFELRRINNQPLRQAKFAGKLSENPGEYAHAAPTDQAVIQGLRRTVFPGRIAPAQSILDNEHDAAEHFKIVRARHPMRKAGI